MSTSGFGIPHFTAQSVICVAVSTAMLLLGMSTLCAQSWNQRPQDFDPEKFTAVDPDAKPAPMSCEAGASGKFKMSFSAEDDLSFSEMYTFPTDKAEWTQEDMNEYDKEFNKTHKEKLGELLRELQEELEVPEELLLRQYRDAVYFNEWDKACTEDCKRVAFECEQKSYRHFIDAGMTASFRTTLFFTNADATPMEVTHSVEIVVMYTGTAYFEVGCKCKLSDEAVSDTPSRAQDRIGAIAFEPVTFQAGPDIDPEVLAYFTFDVLPGNEIEYLNARFSIPGDDTPHWLVRNVPLPVFPEPQEISYLINIEELPPNLSSVSCAYMVGDWQASADFPEESTADITPAPVSYNVPALTGDPGLDIPGIMAAMPAGGVPGLPDWRYRGCDIPNIDLDCSKDRTDSLGCGPASAANSLQWLIKQHPELAGDQTSHRAKVDSLKKYMNKDMKKGVRFDSMVVGKLTLIDKLKLPIHVKYQTKHESGDVQDPLASTEPPRHQAENHGKRDVAPSFDWVKSEIDKGEDVEIQVGWYGPGIDGKLERRGGHWVVVTGYFDNGMVKGIWFKDDTDQCAKGGLRHEYHNWGPGEHPHLEGVTDDKGNVAIIESAVSESYDPSITFEESEPLDFTYDEVDLTGPHVKPGYPFTTVRDRNFPWLPVVGGVVGAGVVTTILLTQEDDPVDCSFNITAQELSPTCGMPTGSVTVSATPQDNYTYAWSNGASTSAVSGLVAGSYTVTVTRTGTTCTRTLTVELENININPLASFVTEDAHCGENDGSATISLTPELPYTYAWSNGGTGISQTGLAPGTYSVTATHGTCQVSTSLNIGELPPVFDIEITPTSASCGMADGSATATVSPAGSYALLWSNGQTGAQLTDVSPGEYGLTVTIAGTNCQKTTSVAIGENPADHELTFTTTPAGCGVSDGSVSVTVEPDGAYDFLWSNGSMSPTLTDIPAGDYSVTVTKQGTDCAVTETVTVDEEPADFNITFTTTPATCGTADGGVTTTVEPAGTYAFTWSNGASTSDLHKVTAGEYTLTVTSANGCSSISSVVVEENPIEYLVSISTTPGNCLGEGTNITLELQTPGSGPLEIVATGPDGPHTVMVPAGTVNLNKHFTLLPGNWSIVVRDVSLPGHCTQQFSADLDDNAPLVMSDDSYSTTVGQDVTGNVLDNDSGVQIQVTDHTQPSGGTLVQNSDGSFTFTPPPGETGEFTYQYTVTDACGNTGTATVTIQVTTVNCTFEATFTTVPADCGLSTGSITTMLVPAGVYTFEWSNGAMSQDLNSIPAGQYSVTVTSADQMCDKTYTVDVGEVPTTYLTDVSTSPGNCTGEGEITITLVTPGNGPLIVTVDGPEGTVELMLGVGQHNLSSSMNIPSGDYTITVYDAGAGQGCAQTVDVTVDDNTPELVALDDFYETTFNTPVDGNMLDNDEGLGLEVIAIGTVTGGTVEWNADGSFTFTPDPGFSGTADFTYTVRDACGNESEALVEIFVEEAICDFTTQFVNTNADCGFASGNAFAQVDPPGTYFYQWSTGDTGPMLDGVSAGIYSVTIEDVELGCSLEFETEILEDPAEYISDIEVIQPVCPASGDIRFTVSSFGGGPFDITVTHPNGIEVFTVGPGQVILSDFIDITDGDYNIMVVDQNAGPDCIDSFDATITGSTTITIDIEAIFPPSEPSSMDGAIIVAITMPGTPPYTILLNGEVWGVSDDPNIAAIEGLGAGEYTVQLQDANGCLSNILVVVVPFPGPGLQIGFGVMTWNPAPAALPEQASIHPGGFMRSYVEASLQYRLGGVVQESSIMIVPDSDGMVARFSQLADLWHGTWKGLSLKAQGGIAVDAMHGQTDVNWTLRGSASRQIGRILQLNARGALRGWEEGVKAVGEIGVRVDVTGFTRSVSFRE